VCRASRAERRWRSLTEQSEGDTSEDPEHGREFLAAIEFAEDESAVLEHFVSRLLEMLQGSDFAIAFPHHRMTCMLHHHKQLWWTTRDAAVADTQCVTFQRRLVPPDTTESARADDVPVQMMAISRYADRFERRGGGWRIAARVCILESMTMTPIASPELVPTDQVMAVRSQEDASYRVFASLRNEASRAAEVSG